MMGARTDGRPFERQAIVNPTLCVSCGICVGSCPTSMPFRTAAVLSPGIDLPDHSMAMLRDTVHAASAKLAGDARVIVFGCEHGPRLDGLPTARATGVLLRCIGQLPPAFIDYVLSRDLADGVVLAGCSENSCHARTGLAWTQARIERRRDPHLRARVPPDRLTLFWQGRNGPHALEALVERFAAELARAPRPATAATGPVRETAHD
ncbi:MAG: hydrogenase iron-sulfur subunit [Alphaproteobacteria bacterium]|nr:hydrogenase iron-sulfur subunit [Alphaproteobacteria bacterium]